MKAIAVLFAVGALAAQASAFAAAPDFDQELATIVRDYDTANLGSDKESKIKALDAVMKRAADLVRRYPTRGEAWVWHGMTQASLSAVDTSLSLVKQARKTLEAAVAMTPNPAAVNGYSTLGGVYANVPGFPIAFGDKKVARSYFQKALALEPASLSANLGYANLLFKQDDYAGAVKHATAALNAPARPGRDAADKAARTTADNLIAKAKAKLR